MSLREGSIALGLAALLSLSAAAHASLTSINPLGGGDGSERCLVGATSRCSGGAYSGAMSIISIFERDLGYAQGSFVRVDDGLDKIWANTADHGGSVQALARYANDSSRLGYDAGSGFTPLTSVIADNTVRVNHPPSYFADAHRVDLKQVADQWTTIPLAAGAPFALILDNLSMGYRLTSNPGTGVGSAGYANSGLTNLDFMVTFLVPGATPHYFVAWEDRSPASGTTFDHDYNDYVVELQFVQPLPVPASAALFAAGLAGLGGLRLRSRLGVGAGA